jgi:hypothetical protein
MPRQHELRSPRKSARQQAPAGRRSLDYNNTEEGDMKPLAWLGVSGLLAPLLALLLNGCAPMAQTTEAQPAAAAAAIPRITIV